MIIQKKVLLVWAVLSLIIGVTFASCHVYDQVVGKSDGLIRGIAYRNVFPILLALCLLGLLMSLGLTARQKIIQNLSLSLLSGLLFWVLLESIGHLLIRLNWISVPPFQFRRFYIPPEVAAIRPFPAGDLNPIAGRSHLPNGSDTFINCEGDTLQWSYNAVGAHDCQRQVINPDPKKKRIAIVGDSFLEGYMVNSADRWSSLLERKTRLEHLNFAVNGSNPVHYYLMYKGVAKVFEADVVIVGILPANDFEILDERIAYTRIEFPQYTPYWQGNYPHYQLRYSLANVTQSILYRSPSQASVLNVIDSLYATLPSIDKVKADVVAHSSLFRLISEFHAKKYRKGQSTRFEDFDEEGWRYVSYSLTKLVEEAKGKTVLILSIPTLSDLMALRNGRINRIDPLLASFCCQNGVQFIPLASCFLAYPGGNLEELYVPCDGHFSVKGERFMANLLLSNPVYRSITGLSTPITNRRKVMVK